MITENRYNGWISVYTTPVAYRAEIVKSVLETHGIQAVLLNKIDPNYPFGFSDIFVNHPDRYQALDIIEAEISFS